MSTIRAFSCLDYKVDRRKSKTLLKIVVIVVSVFSFGILFGRSCGPLCNTAVKEDVGAPLLGSAALCPCNSSICSSRSPPSLSFSDSDDLISKSASFPRSRAAKKVLLVTYGRSGSSFTSALVGRHQDVFFVYEPLHVHSVSFFRGENPGKTNYHNLIRKTTSVALVNTYLNCNFLPEYIDSLVDEFNDRSESTRTLSNCMNSQAPGTSHVTCFLNFLNECSSKKVIFIKTIRYRVAWVDWLLENNPNFILMFLVRDPRAQIFSQSKTFDKFSWKGDITNFTTTWCKILGADLAEAERFKKLYPDRVRGIRYEHGAIDPYGYTKDIYDYLGLEYDAAAENFVDSLTKESAADKQDNKKLFSVFRSNFTEAMNRWRHSAGFENVKKIDKICGHLYSKLGYEFVKSQKDLVSARSLVGTPAPNGIF